MRDAGLSTEIALPNTEIAVQGREIVPQTSPLQNVRLELVNSIDQAYAFKRWLGERRRVLGLDTESAGLRVERDTLRLVQFGDLNTGWAIPWEHWGGVALEALTSYEGPIVEHNSSYDNRVLKTWAKWDAPWYRIGDTMTKMHLIDPMRPKGLKPLGDRIVDPRASAGQAVLDKTMTINKWTWGTVPIDHPHYWCYSALDPVLTCHIDEYAEPIIQQRGYQQAYDLEMAVVRICAEMMIRGVRVDLEYCERKAKELREWVLSARTWIKDQYDVKNPTSNQQVIKRLQHDGIFLTKRTESGNAFALDKEVLEALEDQHPLAKYVLAIRKAEKICGSYLENFSEMIGPDGRLHCNINTLGARTGRQSISDPALQTLQRDDPTVREAIIASDGNEIISCDYDQIEMRLVAHLSNDQGLIDAFLSGNDFFNEVASQIFGERIVKGDYRRQLTKNSSYCRVYGGGTAKVAQTAKVTHDVAQAFVAMFEQRFPGMKQLDEEVQREALGRLRSEGRAYVRTRLGREIPEYGNKAYALINYLIQGSAAEILKQAMVNLDASGLGDYMILPIHDEIVLDAPAQEADEIARLMETVMSDMTTYRVPLTASANRFGNRWSTKG